jgi:hypothetical protein
MANEFKLAIGNDQAGSLVTVSPEPTFSGILHPERLSVANHAVYLNGTPFIRVSYGYLTAAAWTALLAAAGLTSYESRDITARILESDFSTWANYNGTIIKPDMSDLYYFAGIWRSRSGDITFIIQDLVAL